MDPHEAKRLLSGNRMTPEPTLSENDYLSTGCTTLNLALTGTPQGGIPKGKYAFLVGDSSSGKTFMVLTMFAEASINKHFEKYHLRYNDVEGGALMSFMSYFGTEMERRLEITKSETIEEFYDDLYEATRQPCIYVVDSMDALSSDYENRKWTEGRKARSGGPKAKGDYGDGKAKKNSSLVRQVLPRLRDTGSILLIISQTRDNMDAGLFEPSKIRSGGHALKFYATAEIWTSVKKKLKKKVRGIEYPIGIIAKAVVKKNRLTGKEWAVEFPLYFSTGIDDIGACVDYLTQIKYWPTTDSGIITATDFTDYKGKRETLIKKLQTENLEEDVIDIVSENWKEIEEACRVERRNKYKTK